MNGVERLLGAGALARHGERVALVAGAQTLTYRDLAAHVQGASLALARLGVGAGDRVAFLMRDTPEFAAAWLGAVRMGAVAVALNNKLSEAEYRHVLADSGARLVLVQDVFNDARPDLSAELARENRIAVAGRASTGFPPWRPVVTGDSPAFAATPEAPAFMLYSSGTTGKPKGIVHTHRAVAEAGGALRAFGIGAGDSVFATSRLFFAYGLEHALLGPLALGATSILSADWPSAADVLEALARHRPAALFSVPTMYRRLLAEPPGRLAALRGPRRFVSAGEPLSPHLVRQWRAATGGELLNLYGMSETFCACLVTAPGTSDGVRTGRPLEGVEVRLEPHADSGAGVLWVRHPALASGYANLPQRTAEQFRDGWFCTGDLFALDAEGHYVHRGRADDQLKIAGQWVQPSEVEDAVAGLPEVAEAACIGHRDAEGLERLALFVVPRGGADQALRAAEQACVQALPRYKRPKWYRAAAELPRTATGKLQRFRLLEILAREDGDKG